MVNADAPDTLAAVGVVLYLEDLKEVSEQTNDAVKYVCSHKVLEKCVDIQAVLNPAASAHRETYLRCVVRDREDSDGDADAAAAEAAVGASLADVADLQEANGE